ncbi:MAG TPA: carboxypeptidase-like regulatory domain-containing protein, partial [Thermoanaerobaculia bacterium]|nr:carboxypeptidase-like regulatory domain-containing protein [Thermoanaerobaculia bacterium]
STKLALGNADARRITITIQPFVVTGRVTLGGTVAGAGTVTLEHREFQWRAGIVVAADGTFRAPMWQRGDFVCRVRTPALPSVFTQIAAIEDPARVIIDIPDGRVRGVVRDAKSGAPLSEAQVVLQTNTADSEELVKLTTAREGTFDFIGVRHGRQKLRVLPPRHLEPDAIAFTLDDDAPLRDVDVRVDAGREVAVVVIDRANDPIAGARVVCVSDGRICARTTTNEDGRAEIAVPADQPATLFAISKEGPFAMVRASRENGRLRIYLPATSSSLQLRTRTTDGRTMPPFSLLMRFNGELVPAEVADELAAVQGLRLATGDDSDAQLRNIPSGSYEFWPYRTDEEAEAIVAAGALFPPIQVDVRAGENKVLVKFAAR